MAYLTLSWVYKRSSSPYFGRPDILSPLHDNEPAGKTSFSEHHLLAPTCKWLGCCRTPELPDQESHLISTKKSFPTNRCFSQNISLLPFKVFVYITPATWVQLYWVWHIHISVHRQEQAFFLPCGMMRFTAWCFRPFNAHIESIWT